MVVFVAVFVEKKCPLGKFSTKASYDRGVSIHWAGLEYWTGLLDCTTGLDYWTGIFLVFAHSVVKIYYVSQVKGPEGTYSPLLNAEYE